MKIIVLLWSAGMGRKLRFFVTKNQERKKALARQMLTQPVSIPLFSGVIVHQSVQADIEKPLELKVKLPIEAYANAPCQDLAHLQSRLKTSNLLPPWWIDASNQQTPLVLFTFQCEPPLFHPKIFYTFHVDDKLTWTMSVCGVPLEVKQCTLLDSHPGKLSSVSDIVSVLGNISTARVCTGNPDKKYTVLVETRNGSFQDPSGKFITSLNPRPSKMEAWYLFQVFYCIVHAWY